MGLGFTEILVIMAILVLIFGARRLPEIGKSLGEGIGNFRDALTGANKKELKDDKKNKDDEEK